MAVYLYWGEEEYNIEKAVKELRNKILDANFSALSHKVLNEPDLKQIVESAQALPMMLGNMLIEVHTSTLFFRGKRKVASDDPNMKKLCAVIEKLNPAVNLLFVAPVEKDSGKKIDSVMKLVKTIKNVGKIQEFPAFKYYQEDQIINWITKQASSKKAKIERRAAESLVQDIGNDLRKLDSELEKVTTAIHPRTSISVDDVKEVVSTNENVFLFADLWLKNDTTAALAELHKLFEKNNPLKIAATLQTVTRKWLKIKVESKSKSSFDISKMVNLPKFVVEKDMQKLSRIPEDRIFKLREAIKETEFKIKSGELPPEMAMEILVMQ